MINGTLGVIQDKLTHQFDGNIVKIFNDEKYSIRAFNFFLLPDIIKLIHKFDPKTIYDNEKDFLNLITILLLIQLSFNEKKLNVEIYTLIYKLISQIVESPDKYSDQLKTGILGCKIFDLTLKVATYDDTPSEHLSTGSSLMLEILLLLKRLHTSAPHCQCIFDFPMTLLNIDRNMTIIGDNFDFDMISYMSFYDYLTKNVDNLDIEIEGGTTTTSIGYNMRTVAKFEYPGVNRMKVCATLDTKLKNNESIAISTDVECKNILVLIQKYNIQNSQSFDIN